MHNGRHKLVKNILIVLASLIALLVLALIFQPGAISFFLMQTESIQHAGTWEDDPKNWYRAFGEEQPAQVKVVHSKYWRSNHFSYEYIYYFEVQAPSEWRDDFIRKKNLALVPQSTARSFRANINSDETPGWFAPNPVDIYEVWDKAGYFGSVWINRTNGHIFFYDMQL